MFCGSFLNKAAGEYYKMDKQQLLFKRRIFKITLIPDLVIVIGHVQLSSYVHTGRCLNEKNVSLQWLLVLLVIHDEIVCLSAISSLLSQMFLYFSIYFQLSIVRLSARSSQPI